MHDDEITLSNTCTDLVSLRKAEAFPMHLLGSRRPGEWLCVRDVCLKIGVNPGDLSPDVFATWLPDPLAQEAYVVIMFYDDETKWSMAAHYHRGRLLDGTSPKKTVQPTGASVPGSSCSTSPPTAPAAEH
jgi:hypothetical protein